MDDFKKLLSDYEIVRGEFEEAKKKPEILREKIRAAEKRYGELQDMINNAERQKDYSVINFMTGDISEAKIKESRENLDRLKKEKSECEDILNAGERSHQKIAEAIQNLSTRLISCRHVFWNAVVSELKNKISSDVITKVHAVYTAASLAGSAGAYENFLRQLFPMPPFDEAQKAQNELAERYGFKE